MQHIVPYSILDLLHKRFTILITADTLILQLTFLVLLVGIHTFLSVEFRLDQVTLLASGVTKALFHDISLPSCSRGSRLSGIDPLPIGKGGIGLNLNKIDTDGTTLSTMISLKKRVRSWKDEIAQSIT
jgi:hypothetical protein